MIFGRRDLIFLIEKIKFPSPKKNITIDITNEIEKLIERRFKHQDSFKGMFHHLDNVHDGINPMGKNHKQALLKLGANEQNIQMIIKEGEKIEENSNQILDFTKEVKNLAEENKIKIVKALWKIVYSNKNADIYEANLMRRLTGLLYIDSKTMANIKDKIKNENSR